MGEKGKRIEWQRKGHIVCPGGGKAGSFAYQMTRGSHTAAKLIICEM